MEYYFDEEKKIYILLASTVQDQEAFNQLALNPAITFAALNPNFVVANPTLAHFLQSCCYRRPSSNEG